MNARRAVLKALGVRLPLPIASLMLIGVGVSIGDALLVAARVNGSWLQNLLAIVLMLGGPIAGIALLVYHPRSRERR